MGHVNYWLLALSFVLGLVLTLAFMISKVTREVPVPDSAKSTASAPVALRPESPWSDPKTEVIATPAANLEATEPDISQEPHGPGSAAPGPGGTGPEGWAVKGNEESKLYHSPESPSYGITRAEVWFRDVPTAEAAGFNRWDSGKSQRGR
jgi:hypothetical protein